ncbi:hypothetical protein DTO021D3_9145 [Paecilomyces variotii]|nr:hypothetical protein DTO032I3_8971 [Paecilomyces variotii]KAJ9273983.1 hypothetical protein DTO021D3_9145 [Paecilomyces variotii]KAJ9283153.1 hypothetical protein DTO021C3_9271 [Paecilomyces variotii]KAJ9320183.1 hypothetical protein DTO027B3_8825 [Paecilomyces variotii]KAJ9403122.1 hypothetical protein DTO045G8_9149 [Paecilomyces variotii]
MKCLKYLRANASRILHSSAENTSSSKGSTSEIESQSQAQAQSHPRLDVLILGGLGGRVDQAFSQVHHLYAMARHEDSPGELYLVSEESISFILRTGRNVIQTPGARRAKGSSKDTDPDGIYYLEENIGILPISGPAVISTTGFEWDVSEWRTEMGGQISTSNHIRADVVTVETNERVLFTAELAGRFKAR